jgi:hypothetical protein
MRTRTGDHQRGCCRFNEFAGVYGRGDLTGMERFEVVELVLASANEAHQADLKVDVNVLRGLLPRMRGDAAVIVAYSEGLEGTQFSLGFWLRNQR